MEYVIFFVLE